MKKEDLRIVFMGTPEFAVGTLEALVRTGYRVVGVVTQPDRPVGRHGSVLQPSEVKKFALDNGIPVLQPEKMKDPEFLEQLRSWGANLQVVVAFRMLPEVVWAMPEYGTFNVHASLLPQYRGAAPINWAIINGEKETGVTTFFLDKEIDTGRIICRRAYGIAQDADVETVYHDLMRLGADLCLETLDRIVATDGRPESIAQERLISAGQELHNAPKIFKETCEIDWKLPARRVHDMVRGLSPVPAAWTTLQTTEGKEMVMKIYRTAIAGKCADVVSGSIVVEGRSLYVAAGSGELIEIQELQLAGKKRMAARDFLNGNHALAGARMVPAVKK